MALRRLPRLFFFQAEDGIRDKLVTGVQTCALPISSSRSCDADGGDESALEELEQRTGIKTALDVQPKQLEIGGELGATLFRITEEALRSEERRVGKECRCRWLPYRLR